MLLDWDSRGINSTLINIFLTICCKERKVSGSGVRFQQLEICSLFFPVYPGEEVYMSGHSKWSSIKHKKAATDAKRGKIFTKLDQRNYGGRPHGRGRYGGQSQAENGDSAGKS